MDASFNDKEREVLDLLLQSMSSVEIAEELGLTKVAIDHRIFRIRRRLRLETRRELIDFYRRCTNQHPSRHPPLRNVSQPDE